MSTFNRNYKDGLFTSYFKDKERLLGLYNAVAGTDYPPTVEIEFKTLENSLMKTFCNDLAFTIEGRLVVLFEHQSSVNENMPLRMLLYISDIFRGSLKDDQLYRKEIKPLPTPEFFVIYNGKDKYPDKKVLRLSDAFAISAAQPVLELIVPVYNVAAGHNEELLGQCAALSDYSRLVSLVNEYEEAGRARDEAIEMAIHYCIDHDIMRGYLLENSDEVRRMISMEWDEEIYRRVLKEEGREEGIAQGLNKGREEGMIEAARRLKSEGTETALIVKVTGLTEQEIGAL